MRTRILRLVASWVLIAIGVPMLIRAALGVAPFDVFNTGVSRSLDLTLGIAFIVDALAFYAIGWALGARPGWGSLVGTVVIGSLVNAVLAVIPEQSAMTPRLALLFVGTLMLAVGICLVVTSELGAGPTEEVMLGLINHGMGVVPARWISDGTPFVIGLLLGGSFGPGTIAFALTMGPMVKFGLNRLNYQPRRHTPYEVDVLGW